jgi:hypothetical protein
MLGMLQRLLLEVLLTERPDQELPRRLEHADGLTNQEIAWLRGLDADGLIMTGLMVKKLRFERLTRADGEAAKLFEEQPSEFVRLFQAYTTAVAPSVYFAGQEASLFRQWRQRSSCHSPTLA